MRKFSKVAMVLSAFYLAVGLYFALVVVPDFAHVIFEMNAPLPLITRIVVAAPRLIGMVPSVILIAFCLLMDLFVRQRWLRRMIFIILGCLPVFAMVALVYLDVMMNKIGLSS